MAAKKAVFTTNAPNPLPQFSQAVVHNGMVYCSGSIGINPTSKQIVEGGIAERAAQTLRNLSAVLKAAGSSIKNVVKVNVFLTTMENFAEMNKAYDPFFEDGIKPCRTCVAVKELPFGTDVEIECIAYL
ncbi:hypothetical protein AJ80_06870 [Polytolypa hystricis UAMH7299]|uniref:Uncharacterized protein n=1 Tax=Polytolypa hystricis (strain UAMH7299) TaxID=1447883 RepID=A0A2B7XTF3_POLH7|nr:hypothetical protein AJ80_06870 [Polytolypa hystricis UAMH7299]